MNTSRTITATFSRKPSLTLGVEGGDEVGGDIWQHQRKRESINPRADDVPNGQIGLPFAAAEEIRRICDCAGNLVVESK